MPHTRSALVTAAAFVAVIAASTVASATTYAAPPSGDQPQTSDPLRYPIARGTPEQGYANTNLNVRQGPTTRHRSIGSVARGDVLDIERCERGWCLVSAPGLRGWSSERFIGFGENPYHRGPQLPDPGIPPQEPGTYDRAPVGRY